MQVIHFDQEVQVCGLLNFLFELLCHASHSFALVLKIWAIFLFFLFSFPLMLFSMDFIIFFAHALWHGFLFFSFCIAHIFFFGKRRFWREMVMTQ